MKKLLALVMALALSLSLAACGGGDSVDSEAIISAFNTASTALGEVSALAQENLDLLDQETVDALTQMAAAFGAYKEEIEAGELSQERASELLTELKAYPDQIAALKTTVEDQITAES